MSVSLSNADRLSDSLAARFGFREFTFRDGYFRLNGKRLVLKSAHTVGHYPLGLCRPPDREMLRRELRSANPILEIEAGRTGQLL